MTNSAIESSKPTPFLDWVARGEANITDYAKHDIGGDIINVPEKYYVSPEKRFKSSYEQKKATKTVSSYEKDRIAEACNQLTAAARESFGGKEIDVNDDDVWYHQSLEFLLPDLRSVDNELKKLMDTTHRVKYIRQLHRRDTRGLLFNLNFTTMIVANFANQSSPLRIGAKRVDPSFVARFDEAVKSDEVIKPENRRLAIGFTVTEMVSILQETRKYAEELLESVGAETSQSNVSSLLQLLQVKSLRVVKENFTAMPYLKVHKSVDKNLALCAARGLNYSRMHVFSVVGTSPSEDELDTLLSAPYAIQVGLCLMQ